MKLFDVKVMSPDNVVEESFILSKSAKTAMHDVLSFRRDGYVGLSATKA